MTDSELNRAVARATGETVNEIRSRGFGPLTHIPVEPDPSPRDWTTTPNDERRSTADPRSTVLGSRA